MSMRRNRPISPFSYAGKGFVSCKDGIVTISTTDLTENRSTAFTVADGKVEIATRNVKEERLKATERDEADLLGDFTEEFVKAQRRIIPRRKTLSEGDRVTVTDIHEDAEGRLWCKPAGEDAEEMALFNDELVVGTEVRDLIPYLYANDFIPDARVESDADGIGISIRRSYLAFAIQEAEIARRNKHYFQGRVLYVDEQKKRVFWMTACGFFGISRIREGLEEGDEAVLYVVSIQNRDDCYINVDVDDTGGAGLAVQRFDEETLLEKFIKADAPAEDESRPDGSERVLKLLRELEDLTVVGALDRYRTLLAARFLAVAVQNQAQADQLAHRADILQRKILYAQGKPVRALDNAPAEVACLYPGAVPEAFLGEPGIAGRIAHLLTAAKTAREEPDIVPVKPDALRKRICALLGVEDAFRASGAHVTGKYGLGEGNEVEFKSSYVMRNDGRGPDLDYQGRGQVFEAVCGFLNANGGILFLGVNDSGDPVATHGRGLDGDMDWLVANYDKVNARGRRLLGHNVPKADTIDHFVLFLQQEKKVYFKDTLQDNITIEPTEDQDAIRITVKPAEYEIAYLYKDRTWADGTAYVRDGNQTLPMTEEGKRRRLMSLKRVDRNISHLVRLQEAIDKKHKVYLRGYASGNSGEVRDRLVVPINLFYDDEKVWCYDLEDRNFKQFNLSRIDEVDTDVPDPEYNHDFKPCEADVFSWVDKDHDYPVRLRLDVMAYNYLVEHFAGARHLPENELYQEDNTHWILATTVHGLGPLRWYYLMLADKIEILDSPAADALKEEVRRFVGKWLQ
jgi:Predicted transcriptional regulator